MVAPLRLIGHKAVEHAHAEGKQKYHNLPLNHCSIQYILFKQNHARFVQKKGGEESLLIYAMTDHDFVRITYSIQQ